MKNLLLLLGIVSLAGFVFFRGGSDSNGVRNHDRITTISSGESVNFEDHFGDDWTVFEFGADWLAACRQLGPQLEALVVKLDDVRLCKINIKSWGSDVARQHSIKSIPQLVLYDGTTLVAQGTREVLLQLAAKTVLPLLLAE